MHCTTSSFRSFTPASAAATAWKKPNMPWRTSASVIGSIIGAGLLAWVAKIGCETGLTSAGLIHHVYGQSFAKLPVMLNIVQLVGWTTFELVVMHEGTQAITQKAFGVELSTVWTTLLWGGILILLMTGSMLTLVRRFVSRFGLPLVILSLLWLSWHFVGVAQQQGMDALLARDAPLSVQRMREHFANGLEAAG